jgi:hypothetical protein
MVTPHLVSSNSCTAQLEFAGAMTGSSARAQLSKSGAFLRLTILKVSTGRPQNSAALLKTARLLNRTHQRIGFSQHGAARLCGE